ncbi:hypothetical protein FRB93_004305 [Tulasnella sp. JGI-2019a]|nr:hypothetical protein FRB93_004305 [Tulasnella sp. JGI-2019a]
MYPLCMVSAEWIVEDYLQAGSLVPLAHFGTTTFIDANTETASGTTVDPSEASIVKMRQNGQLLTRSGTVVIAHV